MNSASDIEQVYSLALEEARKMFGERLVATYLIGSLSHGGFSYVSSDIDVAFVIDEPISEETWDKFGHIDEVVKNSDLALADRLSVFWSSINVLSSERTSGAFPPPTRSQGVFPPFDILDLIQNGTLIQGSEIRHKVRQPEIADLFVAGVEFMASYVLTTDLLTHIREVDTFLTLSPMKMSKDILFPARLIYTLETGKMGNNDEAIAHYCKKVDASHPYYILVSEAGRMRAGETFDLVALRAAHPALKDFYSNLLTLHIEKMKEMGEEAYAETLKNWQNKLTTISSTQ